MILRILSIWTISSPALIETGTAGFSFCEDAEGKDVNIETLVEDTTAIQNVKTALADIEVINAYVADPLENKKSLTDTFFKVDEKARGKKAELIHFATTIFKTFFQAFQRTNSR